MAMKQLTSRPILWFVGVMRCHDKKFHVRNMTFIFPHIPYAGRPWNLSVTLYYLKKFKRDFDIVWIEWDLGE